MLHTYLIEYYDPETDKTDYVEALASSAESARYNFIRKYHGTRIVVNIERNKEGYDYSFSRRR